MHDTDSLNANQQRLERLRAEAKEQEAARQAAEERRLAREAADREEAKKQEQEYLERVMERSPDSREALVNRIRQMREDVPKQPAPPPLTEAARKRLEEEQEAGRRALAFHQAEQERARDARIAAEKAEAEKLGHMEPVITPNPTQQEVFPAVKATLGKRK